MLGFLRSFCFVGLPVFAVGALWIWRPNRTRKESESSIALKVAWTVVALGLGAAFCFPILFLPFVLAAIWRPDWRPVALLDRIAWTTFSLGISLMATMVLYAAVQEGDGDFRTWETIRLHSRVFLAISTIPIFGPLIVYLVQALKKRRSPAAKKPPIDDWDAESPFDTRD